MKRAVLVALAFVACARGGPRASSIAVAPANATAQAETTTDPDAARERALAAMDAGDFVAARNALRGLASDVTRRLTLALEPASAFANVRVLRVGARPPAKSTARVEKLVTTRTMGAPGEESEIEVRVAGRTFTNIDGALLDGVAVPPFVEPRLGRDLASRLRDVDGKWGVVYGTRFIAILEADGAPRTILDFAAWRAEPGSDLRIEGCEIAGDDLFVRAAGAFGGLLASIDSTTGAVRWQSTNGHYGESFAVGTDRIIAWLGPGEIVALDRATGEIVARRATPETRYPKISIRDGGVVVHGAGQTAGGLLPDERLTVHVAVTNPPPPLADPPRRPPPRATIPADPVAPPDARIVAWKTLDAPGADGRAAVLAMRSVIDAHPTNAAALALDDAARAMLDASRKRAGDALAKTQPIPLGPSGAPTRAPIARPRARRLVRGERRKIVPARMAAELPPLDDAVLVAPAWVPDRIAVRRRDLDAGDANGPLRVEVYKATYSPSWIVTWREGAVVSVLEHPTDVRYAVATEDIVFAIVWDQGRFALEARNAKSGASYWRSRPELRADGLVVEDGYVIALFDAKARIDAVLFEADTGRVAERFGLGLAEPALLFRRRTEIVALDLTSVTTLRLE